MTGRQPIRVAVFDQSVSAGGVRRFTLAMLNSWLKLAHPRDFQFTLFWPKTDSAGLPLSLPFDPVPPHLTVVALPPLPRRGGVEWLIHRSEPFDLAYFPSTVGMLPLDTDLERPWPVVATLHDLAHEFTSAWGTATEDVRREARRWTRFADRLIFSSDHIRNSAVSLYQIPAGQTHRIYLAPPVFEAKLPGEREIAEIRNRYGLPQRFALSPGTAMIHKNTHVLVGAFQRLKEQGVDLPLVLVGPLVENLIPGNRHGSVAPYHMAIQNLIQKSRMEVGRDLFILGHVPDEVIPSLYLASSLVVTASVSEAGLNGPIFEAMWYRRPIACSRLPQFVERLGQDDRLVKMFDPASEEDVARAIREWVPQLLKPSKQVRDGYRWVTRRCWDDCAQDYLRVFRQAGRESKPYRSLPSDRPGESSKVEDSALRSSPAKPIAQEATVHAAGPPFPVVWIGPIYDPSGYADEVRNFLRTLPEQGIAPAARSLGRHSPAHRENSDPGLRAILDAALARPAVAGSVCVIHFPASGFRKVERASYLIGRTMFETDSLPPEWVVKCNQMNEIWVPSDFNMETFRAAGVSATLYKVPGGIDCDRFRPGLEPLPIPGARGARFLSIFEWSYRKGWDVLLRAWCQAFSAGDDVTLLLRAYPVNAIDAPSAAAEIERRIDAYLAGDIGKNRSEVAPIIVLGSQIPERDLPRLYAAASAYVGPSRGEGWGRPQMEAMASGLPVIATRWSGNLEFMTDDNSLLLEKSGLVAVDERAENPVYRGQRWAEPSVTHLVDLLKRVVREPEAMRGLGLRARHDMEHQWGWEKAAAVAAARLKEVEAARAPNRWAPENPASPSLSILWEGPQFVHHSLAVVNREICLELASQGHELSLSGCGESQFRPGSDPRFRSLAQRLGAVLARKAEVHVRHQWPPSFEPPPEGHWVMIQPWEFGSLPREWIEAMRDRVDDVWVYTNFVRDCYLRSGMPADRVHVVPLGVRAECFRPGVAPKTLQTRKRFKFLFVGGTIRRKGPEILLSAYLDTFTRQDDVSLVIKDMGGSSFYAGQTMAERIRLIQADPEAPEILYLTEDMEPDELPGLYAACDCLVHPYRGEGFGLPIAEAMACGLPVIVTGGGACLDFCDETVAYLIPCRKVLFPENRVDHWETSGQPYWFEADPLSTGRLMRRVFDNREEARATGARASQRIRSQFTWRRAADSASSRMRELIQRPLVRGQVEDKAAGHDQLVGLVVEEEKALSLGRVALEQEDLEGAEAVFAQAVARFPNLAEAHLGLGSTRLALGRSREAAQSLHRAAELAPPSATLQNQFGVALFQSGDVPGAEAAFSEAMSIDPTALQPILNLVDLYHGLGQLDAATRALKDAIHLDPSDPEVLVAFGTLSLELGDLEGTTMALKKLEATHTGDPGVDSLRRRLAERRSAGVARAVGR